MSARVGVDTGGTFTDLVAEVDGRLCVAKVPSTRADPVVAVLEGLRVVDQRGAPVIHGTTVATNALLERRGARVLFVATEGFEDLAVIGRQDRPALYDPAPTRAASLQVAAVGVGGAGAEAVVRAAREASAEAIAVCLLEAYRDPAEEERLGAALAPLGLPVSLSSRVLREFREFERASTTLADAFVRPEVGRYLSALGDALAPGPLSVMLSNGGSASAVRAADSPVLTVLSGPAGGALGAREAAGRAGLGRAISFDMGGTSTDVALVGGTMPTTTETVVGGVRIAAPAVEILTVGAGGGSIASVDAGGALRVGPESAGADPGPACYGRGGEAPTVTDAHVVLGHLGSHLASGLSLRPEAARRAVGRLGGRLGVDPREAAAAVLDVAEAAMERPMRRLTVERGEDPRDLALVAFGGAGGLHAVRLAVALGISRVLFPAYPGLLSALGMLGAPRRAEAGRTVLAQIAGSGLPEGLERTARDLGREAEAKLSGEGAVTEVSLTADVRFVGQSHEITVGFDGSLAKRFREEHRRRHGFVLARPLEVVTVRAVAESRSAAVTLPERPEGGTDPGPAQVGRRVTSLGEGTTVYERELLLAGMAVRGPAIVVEMSSTLLVPAGWSARVLPAGDLLVTAA